jgi:signal transduction histidine kinase/CheY-like chemotaxis protein
MEQRRFNLIKRFSLGSSIVIILAAVLLGWMFRVIAIDELKKQGERYNLVLAQAISNAIWSEVEGVINMVPENKAFSERDKNYSVRALENPIKLLLKNTNVLKVKIYNNNGRIIYATDHERIGEIDNNTYFTNAAASKRLVLTRLGHQEQIKTTNGTIFDRHILESYLPISQPGNDHVQGVFEIYSDISDSYQDMQNSQLTFMLVLGAILAIVYLTLFIVVRHADKVIKKQAREREGYLHEIENINEDLDAYARELTLARDLALDASKAKSAFLANMSHELRTPLNAIIGYSEMMADEMTFEGRDSDASDLNKIKNAGAHLLAVINDILDLSKIEAGRMELHLENIDVASAVNDVVETARPLADKQGNTIKVSIAEDIDEMFTDLTRVRQVLLNLLSNACKFTKNGVIRLEVNYKNDDQGMVIFNVKDTGVGMHDEQIQKIFEAFKQADLSTTKEFGGTGLGLTISKRFCEMLGGEIMVRSEPSIGSTFSIMLPVRSSLATGRESVASQHMVSAENVRLSNNDNIPDERRSKVSKILVIDDDVAVSDLVTRTLTSDGFEVSVVNDASKAIDATREGLPDAILLDVMMPEIDGWAILKNIKHDAELGRIPVIMMTVVDNYAMADSLGADGFVIKPINRKKLKKAITLCLRASQVKNSSEKVMTQ